MLILVAAVISSNNGVAAKKLNVIYAVNAGGDNFEDSDGIVYQKDPSTQGVASDYGLRLNIDRVPLQDAVLYQTERYSHTDFGYDIPVKEDGSYVLVVKFAEVYFRSPGQKVFNVVLNSAHLIAQDLDIFANVGYATAHDEIIPFQVSGKGKKLNLGGQTSDIVRGTVRLDFMKGHADNPKVNAFYVVKGSIHDIPQLPPPSWDADNDQDETEEEEEPYFHSEDDEDIHFSRSDLGNEAVSSLNTVGRRQTVWKKINIRSGQPVEDPWDREPVLVVYMPLFGSIAASADSIFIVRCVLGEKY